MKNNNFMCHGQKILKNGPKWETFLSVAFIISEIIHQMIFIYGTSFTVLMCKMAISLGLFYFFKILIFFVARRVKEQKIAQHDKKTLSHSVSQEL